MHACVTTCTCMHMSNKRRVCWCKCIILHVDTKMCRQSCIAWLSPALDILWYDMLICLFQTHVGLNFDCWRVRLWCSCYVHAIIKFRSPNVCVIWYSMFRVDTFCAQCWKSSNLGWNEVDVCNSRSVGAVRPTTFCAYAKVAFIKMCLAYRSIIRCGTYKISQSQHHVNCDLVDEHSSLDITRSGRSAS